MDRSESPNSARSVQKVAFQVEEEGMVTIHLSRKGAVVWLGLVQQLQKTQTSGTKSQRPKPYHKAFPNLIKYLIVHTGLVGGSLDTLSIWTLHSSKFKNICPKKDQAMGPTQSRNKLPSLPEPVTPAPPDTLGAHRWKENLITCHRKAPGGHPNVWRCFYVYVCIYIYIYIHTRSLSNNVSGEAKLFSEKEMKIRAAAWPAYLGKVTLYSWKFIQICIPLRVNYICSWRGRTVSVSGMWTQVWKKFAGSLALTWAVSLHPSSTATLDLDVQIVQNLTMAPKCMYHQTRPSSSVISLVRLTLASQVCCGLS